jgi:hypothetical protein
MKNNSLIVRRRKLLKEFKEIRKENELVQIRLLGKKLKLLNKKFKEKRTIPSQKANLINKLYESSFKYNLNESIFTKFLGGAQQHFKRVIIKQMLPEGFGNTIFGIILIDTLKNVPISDLFKAVNGDITAANVIGPALAEGMFDGLIRYYIINKTSQVEELSDSEAIEYARKLKSIPYVEKIPYIGPLITTADTIKKIANPIAKGTKAMKPIINSPLGGMTFEIILESLRNDLLGPLTVWCTKFVTDIINKLKGNKSDPLQQIGDDLEQTELSDIKEDNYDKD